MSILNRTISILSNRYYGLLKCSRSISPKSSSLFQQSPSSLSNPGSDGIKEGESEKTFLQLAEYRFIFPEFLPDPKFEFRHKIREKLERGDMLRRRAVIDIPEFYVGSIIAATTSDPYASGKENRFVGICIARTYVGLRATFTLRNIVDRQGVEIMYDMYNPTILSIEVLKLEKRLDDHLYYLRDAPPEYSTFPFDMEPEFRVHEEPVPINPLKVPLNEPPWHIKWEQRNLKGIQDLPELHKKRLRTMRMINALRELDERDLVKEYRQCIPEEDQAGIWKEVDQHLQKYPPRKQAWKRTLQKAKPKSKKKIIE